MSYHDLRFDQGEGTDRNGLADRILKGEVFVFREALQAFGLNDMWRQASLRGIEKSVGKDAAERADRDGFHRIHEWVAAEDIPGMTDAVYAEIEPSAHEFLDCFMHGAFPGISSFYFERTPNVRFHIPYDLTQEHKKAYNEFAKNHGQGKIAAHGPHRDSWLDCPSNGLNLWFAMGRIRPGNGMTIYPEDYEGEYVFQRSGNLADGQKLHQNWTFDLYPGDVLMFHTDHVHGSVLNRTNETRFAISCRLSIDKPIFPQLHHHTYVHSGWNNSSVLKPLAELPAMAQPGYVSSFAKRVRDKLLPALAPGEPDPLPQEIIGTKVGDTYEVPLSALEVGGVHGVSAALCVARLSEDTVIAMTRRCPHQGGDLANGWIEDGNVVCPWHSLPFDPHSGKSACKTLPSLKRVACEIQGDKVVINPKTVLNAEDGSTGAAVASAASRPIAQ